jgi:hypothetical protein
LSRYRFIHEIFDDRVAMSRVIHASRDFLIAWGRRRSHE